MLQDIQSALPLGFFLSFLIGPVFFVLLETSATKGFRAALAFNTGVILTDILFIIIAYFSSYQLLENISNQPGLFVFGGVIITIYGLVTFFKKDKKEENSASKIKVHQTNYLGLFIKGIFLNIINVGVLIFWLGIIIVIGPSLENDSNRFIVFFTTMLITYFVTDILKILLAKQLKQKLTPVIIMKVKKVLGIILVICGLVLISKGFLPKEHLNPSILIEDMS